MPKKKRTEMVQQIIVANVTQILHDFLKLQTCMLFLLDLTPLQGTCPLEPNPFLFIISQFHPTKHFRCMLPIHFQFFCQLKKWDH